MKVSETINMNELDKNKIREKIEKRIRERIIKTTKQRGGEKCHCLYLNV